MKKLLTMLILFVSVSTLAKTETTICKTYEVNNHPERVADMTITFNDSTKEADITFDGWKIKGFLMMVDVNEFFIRIRNDGQKITDINKYKYSSITLLRDVAENIVRRNNSGKENHSAESRLSEMLISRYKDLDINATFYKNGNYIYLMSCK